MLWHWHLSCRYLSPRLHYEQAVAVVKRIPTPPFKKFESVEIVLKLLRRIGRVEFRSALVFMIAENRVEGDVLFDYLAVKAIKYSPLMLIAVSYHVPEMKDECWIFFDDGGDQGVLLFAGWLPAVAVDNKGERGLKRLFSENLGRCLFWCLIKKEIVVIEKKTLFHKAYNVVGAGDFLMKTIFVSYGAREERNQQQK